MLFWQLALKPQGAVWVFIISLHLSLAKDALHEAVGKRIVFCESPCDAPRGFQRDFVCDFLSFHLFFLEPGRVMMMLSLCLVLNQD